MRSLPQIQMTRSKYTFHKLPFMSSSSNSSERCEWFQSVTCTSAPECGVHLVFCWSLIHSISPPLFGFPPLFQVHIIDFDDENNIINKTVLLHQAGEIWHIGASPADKAVLTTCYNKSESQCFPLWPTAFRGLSGRHVALFCSHFFSLLLSPPTAVLPATHHLHLIIQFAFSFSAVNV